jgi:hypothetical protein
MLKLSVSLLFLIGCLAIGIQANAQERETEDVYENIIEMVEHELLYTEADQLKEALMLVLQSMPSDVRLAKMAFPILLVGFLEASERGEDDKVQAIKEITLSLADACRLAGKYDQKDNEFLELRSILIDVYAELYTETIPICSDLLRTPIVNPQRLH